MRLHCGFKVDFRIANFKEDRIDFKDDFKDDFKFDFKVDFKLDFDVDICYGGRWLHLTEVQLWD